MDNEIHICLAPDNDYAVHAGVTIASVIANAAKDDYLHFYILDGGLTLENKEKLMGITTNAVRQGRAAMMEFVPIHLSDKMPITRLPIAAFYRLKVPDLIKADKCLYLDSDTVVLRSLKTLWETPLNGKTIGLVADCNDAFQKQKWGLDFYGNSGVLLMDLKRYRRLNGWQECLDFCKQTWEKITLGDQDILNNIFAGDIEPLDRRWNAHEGAESRTKFKGNKAYLQSLDNPFIIHYIGSLKPWISSAPRFDKTHYYFRYLRQTPWKKQVIQAFRKRYVWDVFRGKKETYVLLFHIKIMKIKKGRLFLLGIPVKQLTKAGGAEH